MAFALSCRCGSPSTTQARTGASTKHRLGFASPGRESSVSRKLPSVCLFGQLDNASAIVAVRRRVTFVVPLETRFLRGPSFPVIYCREKNNIYNMYWRKLGNLNSGMDIMNELELQRIPSKVCQNELGHTKRTRRLSENWKHLMMRRFKSKKLATNNFVQCQMHASRNTLVSMCDKETSESRAQNLVTGLKHSRRRKCSSVLARFKMHVAVSLFTNVECDQWGRYLVMGRRFRRFRSHSARKYPADVSNSEYETDSKTEEGLEGGACIQKMENRGNSGVMTQSKNGGLISMRGLCSQLEGSSSLESGANESEKLATRDLTISAVNGAVPAEASLVEATQATFGRNWVQGEANSQSNATGKLKVGPQAYIQDEVFLRKVATADDAEAALAMIADKVGEVGIVSSEECSELILAVVNERNVDLAFSILNAMRSTLTRNKCDKDEGKVVRGITKPGWRWAQPDARTYGALVRGLAACLRVSDAIQTISDMRRCGIPSSDEVPFGKVVSCPICNIALAVVQPQHGIQLVACSKCRYQYEIMSGDVMSIESESISMDISKFERGLRALQIMKGPVPAVVHSIVVAAPDGIAQTHRFATASVDLPVQEKDRVTVTLAASAEVGRQIGFLRISSRAPGWRSHEPMSITNHVTGRVSLLLHAPPKAGSGAAFDTAMIFPAAVLLASSDAATALIDPTLPRIIAIGAASAVALGTATNRFVLTRVNQLPQRTVDATALRQQLLVQYEWLQARLEGLTQAAAEEVRLLARMSHLQNKMEVVGKPTYSARIERVCKVRKGLDQRLTARLELIDNYAKISSMIEIEVEMDADVLAAEAIGAAANIAEQIEQLMEIEDLHKQWRLQAEASDEIERLLQSTCLFPDSS